NPLKYRLLKFAALLGLCMAVVCGAVFACLGWDKTVDSEAAPAAPITAYNPVPATKVKLNTVGNYGVMLTPASGMTGADRSRRIDYATQVKGSATFPGRSGFTGSYVENHAITDNAGADAGSAGANDLNSVGWTAGSSTQLDSAGVLAFSEFNAGFEMPAKSKCEVKFTFAVGMYFMGSSAQQSFLELFSFGPTDDPNKGSITSSEIDWSEGAWAVSYTTNPPTKNPYLSYYACEPIGTNNYAKVYNVGTSNDIMSTDYITLTNDTDASKVVTADFAFGVGCMAGQFGASDQRRYLMYAYAIIAKVEVQGVEPLYEPKQSASATFTYSGVEQTIDIANTANFDEFFAEGMYVTNIVRNADGATGTTAPSVVNPGNTATQVKVTDAGTYTVTVKNKGPVTITGHAMVADGTVGDYKWKKPLASDTTGNTTTFELTVKKKQLTEPKLAPPANETTYTGETIEFDIPNYPHAGIAATPTEAYPKDPLSVSVIRKLNGTQQTSNGLPTGSPEKKVDSGAGFLRVSIVD
ncbi:MAG: hypothetical protein K2N74_05360, partial [Clostridiales bacterium]|nr:hypothetical protein [Clostridiales bacterium]